MIADPDTKPQPVRPTPPVEELNQRSLWPGHRARWYPAVNRAVLRRMIDHLPFKPWCAEDPARSGSLVRPAGIALDYPYVQLQAPWYRAWLWLDVDRPLTADEHWPVAPSLVVLNPESGHFHVGWQLRTPVHAGAEARPGPMRWYDSILARLQTALEADSSFTGVLYKNPLHSDHRIARVGRGQYDLSTFESALAGVPKADRPSLDAGMGGRNSALFETLRHPAYRMKPRHDDYAEFYEAVEWLAHAINGEFAQPLPPKEVGHTARSVARWTWFHYTGSGRTAAERKRDSRRMGGVRPRDEYLAEAGDNRAQALLLASDGISRQQIAARLGVSKRRVQQYLGGG